MPPKKNKNKKKNQKNGKEDGDDEDWMVNPPDATTVVDDVYSRMVVTPSPKFVPGGDDADSLSKKVNARQGQFAFFLANAGDAVGRRAIANRALQPGHLLLRESPFPMIVRRKHERSACHWCTKALGDGAATVSCLTCQHAFYCSPACSSKAAATHVIECPILSSMETAEGMIDVDLFRIALAYLVGRQQKRKGCCKLGDFQPTCEDVEAMVRVRVYVNMCAYARFVWVRFTCALYASITPSHPRCRTRSISPKSTATSPGGLQRYTILSLFSTLLSLPSLCSPLCAPFVDAAIFRCCWRRCPLSTMCQR
jgi:hypothetical protein